MKKFSIVLTIISLILIFSIPTNALVINNTDTKTTIEKLENGDYIETIIESVDKPGILPMGNNTITKTKTKNYRNNSGTVLWSVSVTGTFSYNGTTSTCTSCSKKTTSPGSNWSIKSSSVSKSGNSATAKATATYKTATVTKDYSMSVTIKCSADGKIS